MPRRADLELVAAVEAEDGTAVRLQVADCAQTSVEFVDGVKGGRADDVTNLPRAPVLLVDRAGLDTQQEADLAPAGGGPGPPTTSERIQRKRCTLIREPLLGPLTVLTPVWTSRPSTPSLSS